MKLILLNILLFVHFIGGANTLQGVLSGHAGQEVTLVGYKNFNTIELSKTTLSNTGAFTLTYSDSYFKNRQTTNLNITNMLGVIIKKVKEFFFK